MCLPSITSHTSSISLWVERVLRENIEFLQMGCPVPYFEVHTNFEDTFTPEIYVQESTRARVEVVILRWVPKLRKTLDILLFSVFGDKSSFFSKNSKQKIQHRRLTEPESDSDADSRVSMHFVVQLDGHGQNSRFLPVLVGFFHEFLLNMARFSGDVSRISHRIFEESDVRKFAWD